MRTPDHLNACAYRIAEATRAVEAAKSEHYAARATCDSRDSVVWFQYVSDTALNVVEAMRTLAFHNADYDRLAREYDAGVTA